MIIASAFKNQGKKADLRVYDFAQLLHSPQRISLNSGAHRPPLVLYYAALELMKGKKFMGLSKSIPNIFHFIYFYANPDQEFSLPDYICINSARLLNNPQKIYFYSNRIPSGKYWEKISRYAEFVKVEPPENVFGNKLYHLAHKSDVLRMQLLKEYGGIYLDLDQICKKPFTPFLKYDFVMGKQGKWRLPPLFKSIPYLGAYIMGLGNGVILSNKDSEFLKLWFDEYRYFRSRGIDKYWAEMSVIKPLELSKKYPELIHVEPYGSFYYPLYYSSHIKKLFENNLDFPNAYCHHLWHGASYDKYLKNITEEEIININTTYNTIARKYL